MPTTYGAKELNTTNILNIISEYDIFRYYIKNFTDIDIKFCSELRKDSVPSCVVNNYKDTLLYKDFGNNETYNCFTYIQRKYSLTFKEALAVINIDFKLNLSSYINKVPNFTHNNSNYIADMLINNYKDTSYRNVKINKSKKIAIKRRKWNNYDKNYWNKKYYLTAKILNKFNVYPLSHYWINDNVFITDNYENLTYAYYFGKDRFKLLRPNDTKWKWLSNCTSDMIQGWNQLPYKSELLIITKSLKDVMVYNLFNIPSIAPQTEITIIPEYIINNLKLRFKTIVSNYDYDKAGKKGALALRRLYNIKAVMFDDNYDIKDLSEYIEKYGIKETKKLLNEKKKEFCNNL